MKLWQLIIAGVLVHLILFYSIFDIYFTSPLVHGMTPYHARIQAPAKRLVLFVADGLRADRFFELDEFGKPRAPYLRTIIEEKGAWGVSHTRVPTESRPGHVALIAGFYEDVSAVAKGWKENPVEFDSVFNESRFTWSWGSPDILPMFAKGASGNHVVINCYSSDLEDFAGSDMTQLDIWVFKEFKKFFESAATNVTLKRMLQEDKLVFFLHLLGIDTNGHSNKPHSEEYLMNIRVIDAGIKKVVELLNDFYNHDGQTVYIMSADHGMTNWGSHGAGHPHETLTPLVGWGSGIRGPVPNDDCGKYSDNFCNDWRLQHLTRVDVDQADVASLMAFLLGVPFPLNSVGVLPVEYLSGSEFVKAEGLFANAQQMLSQYEVKLNQVRQRTVSVTFRPFEELPSSRLVDFLKDIRNLIDKGHYQDAINESKHIIRLALKGLRYYQTYDRLFLGFSIALGFIGWMGYILHLVLMEHTSVGKMYLQRTSQSALENNRLVYILFCSIGFLVFLLLYIQSLPWTNYFYCLTPVLLWMKFAEGWKVIFMALRYHMKQSEFVQALCSVLVTVLGLEITVLSFFYRELLSVGIFGMAGWALTTGVWRESLMSFVGWFASCILVAIFPLLPVVGGNTNYSLVFVSGGASLLTGTLMVWRFWRESRCMNQVSIIVLCVQLVLVGMATISVKVASESIADKMGTPLFTQVLSWIILVVSPFLPLLTNTELEERLVSIGLAFLAPYILMSITYEGIFMLSLLSLLYFWLQMEFKLCHHSTQQPLNRVTFSQKTSIAEKETEHIDRNRGLKFDDLRRAFFFIFLILTAFFGTGNIASINSFDPASVYCFLTVFNPFLMGALMMLKVVLPFVVVSCTLHAVQVVTGVPLRALMLLILLMSDFMGLHFFFLVRDYGSWLEIGTSISHYIIVMSMITFVMVLMALSKVLTGMTLVLPLTNLFKRLFLIPRAFSNKSL